MHFQSRLAKTILIVFGGLLASAAPSYAFSSFYVFGDSLSDAGNIYLATGGSVPGAPYYNGRFSNGPTWADRVSTALGLGALSPSQAGGTDYAYGYATASSAVPNPNPLPIPIQIPTVTDQVAFFHQDHPVADPSALYAIWIGSNDVLNALGDIGQGTLTVTDAEDALEASAQAEVDAIAALVADGARNLLVVSVPDIGLTPAVNKKSPGLATSLSQTYNLALKNDAKEIPKIAVLHYLDTLKLLDDAVRSPMSFGFTNVTDPCYLGNYSGGGSGCLVPDKYLFWDSVHPTQAGHQAIADLALKTLSGSPSTVPLPASAPLFGAALLAFGAVGYGMKRMKAGCGRRLGGSRQSG